MFDNVRTVHALMTSRSIFFSRGSTSLSQFRLPSDPCMSERNQSKRTRISWDVDGCVSFWKHNLIFEHSENSVTRGTRILPRFCFHKARANERPFICTCASCFTSRPQLWPCDNVKQSWVLTLDVCKLASKRQELFCGYPDKAVEIVGGFKLRWRMRVALVRGALRIFL